MSWWRRVSPPRMWGRGPRRRHGGRRTTPRTPRMLRASPGEINWRQCFSRAARINADWRPPDVSSIVLKERRFLRRRHARQFTLPHRCLSPGDERGVTHGRQALLQYSPASGYPPLRRYLADYLVRKGIVVTDADILIVNGSQQASIWSPAPYWIRATASSSKALLSRSLADLPRLSG